MFSSSLGAQRLVGSVLLAGLLAGCAAVTPTPQIVYLTPAPTEAPLATATPEPTAAPTPTPTPTPTLLVEVTQRDPETYGGYVLSDIFELTVDGQVIFKQQPVDGPFVRVIPAGKVDGQALIFARDGTGTLVVTLTAGAYYLKIDPSFAGPSWYVRVYDLGPNAS